MKKFLFLSIFMSLALNISAQTRQLSLKDVIRSARKNSLDYKIAVNLSQASYWNYRNYVASFLPKLELIGALPEYSRSITQITLPNGQNDFVRQDVENTAASLNITQGIKATGGFLSIGSAITRVQNFGTFKNTAFTSVPFTVNYAQNNLFYNDFKWQKKIEPLKLLEAKRDYIESLENISFNASNYFFSLQIATVQLKLDQQNLANIDTLKKITEQRFKIGTVQLNDLLQTKISLLNAQKSVAASKLSVQTARQDLIRFLNLDDDQNIELRTSDSLRFFKIDSAEALQKAYDNRKIIIEFERREMEAKQALNKTKSETGPSVSLNANLGVSQTGDSFVRSYNELLRNQSIAIRFSIPLIDLHNIHAMAPNKEVLQNLQNGKQDELSTTYNNMVSSVMEYALTSPSQQEATTKGTLFGAYNAVTGYFQNVRNYKDDEAKFKSIMYGTGSQRSQTAFELCNQFAKHGNSALN